LLGRDLRSDVALDPFFELGDDLLVRRGEGLWRRGAGEAPARRSTPWTMSVSCLIARKSADADLLTSCLMTSSRLVIRRRCPSSVRLTFSSSASPSNVAKFFEPFGRPFGLPDLPFWKPAWRGGLA
jgi:hypothetical protein